MKMWKKLLIAGVTSTLVVSLSTLNVAAAPKSGGGTKTSTVTDGAVYTNFGTATDTLGVNESETWEFSKSTALTNYVLENSTPISTVSCKGGGCVTPLPAGIAFSGNVPTLNLSQNDWNAEECIFWTGGQLSTFKTSTTSSTSGGKGSSAWTITHTWEFVYVGSVVEARTSWTLIGISDPGTVQVNFGGKIAGLSGMTWDTGYKYSFGIKNSDGTYRVTTPVLSITDANLVSQSYPLEFNYLDASMESFSDFGIGQVTEGHGYGYNLNQLIVAPDVLSATLPSVMSFPATDARVLLNGDAHLGNDNGGADGSALAYLQLVPFKIDLPAGSFTYQLSVSVKGMAGATDGTPLTIARKVNYIGLGNCQP